MNLADRLNCPFCNARLATTTAGDLHCTSCERIISLVEGVADFLGNPLPSCVSQAVNSDPNYDEEDLYRGATAKADLLSRMQTAAGDRWPAFLGDVIAFGSRPDDSAQAVVTGQMIRSLLLLDMDISLLQACRAQIATLGAGHDRPIGYATLGETQNAIRDTVADTVVGNGLLSGITDVRACLTMVHRVLKPNGRAAFVLPNRRFYGAMCSAMAEALVQRHAQDGIWPEGQGAMLERLAWTKRLLIHCGDLGFLSGLRQKHLFDSDDMIDLGQEVGFATVEMLPLDPDPTGAETMRQLCRQSGADDRFSGSIASLAGAVGQPYFSSLSRRDSSASMLLWLTKAAGPNVRIFMQRPPPPRLAFVEPDAALGGVAPRWSIELLAHETPDGIAVSIGGWCLCNTDVLWVRLTLGGVLRCAPVWRPRPDVHEVLNRNGRYHALNTLCSGLANDLLFDGVHPTDNECPVALDILLASGVTVSGSSPEMLVMGEPTVIAH